MRIRPFALTILLGINGCTAGEDTPSDTSTDDGDQTMGSTLSAADKQPGDEGDNLRTRVCASGATTFGIDVSYHNGTINWTSVKNAGAKYAFIRVSDGNNTHDPKFQTYWADAHAAGVISGPYQFFRPGQDVAQQADFLISSIGGSYTPGDLPPVIDVEATSGLSPSTVAARVRTWVDRVKSRLGIDPIVYTGKFFWRDDVGNPTSFSGNPLWIAAYTSLCPDLPSPWPRWTFWQNSESGSIAGISGDVDLDKFNGSLQDLIAFAHGSGSPPPPPPPPPSASCHSSTLDRDVPAGTCVQAASDAMWYGCTGGVWMSRSGPSGCADAFAWCSSATLGRNVPPRTCVQARSDQIWYQCTGKAWDTPVDVTAGTGPAGNCSSMNSL